jgi:hypothetical protein
MARSKEPYETALPPMDNAWVVIVPDPLVEQRLESIPWRNLDENGGYESNLVPPADIV